MAVGYEAISKALAGKAMKGTYDGTKAPKAWRHLVDDAAKAYAREYGMSPRDFTGPYRNRAAERLSRDWEEGTTIKVNPAPRRSLGKRRTA